MDINAIVVVSFLNTNPFTIFLNYEDHYSGCILVLFINLYHVLTIVIHPPQMYSKVFVAKQYFKTVFFKEMSFVFLVASNLFYLLTNIKAFISDWLYFFRILFIVLVMSL